MGPQGRPPGGRPWWAACGRPPPRRSRGALRARLFPSPPAEPHGTGSCPRACPLQQPVQGAGTGAQPPAAEPPKRPEAACPPARRAGLRPTCPSRLLCKLPKLFPDICPPARQTVPILRTIPGLSRSLFVAYLQIITPPIAESKQNSPSAIPLFCQNRPINA